MQRGRKAEASSTKFARGTLQPVRDGGKTEIIVPGDPPLIPIYLTAEDRCTGHVRAHSFGAHSSRSCGSAARTAFDRSSRRRPPGRQPALR